MNERMREGARLLGDKRPAEALACFDACDGAAAVFGTAVALQMLGRFEEAEDAYERVLAPEGVKASTKSEALGNLIAMAIEKFDLARAERYATRLLGIDAGSAVALQALVVVAVERREFQIAAGYFARLVPLPAGNDGAIEYRLNGEIVERLRNMYGTLAHSHRA